VSINSEEVHDVHTVEDGKIKRTYHVEDWAGAMRQLSGGT
jgi:hypothetical protein